MATSTKGIAFYGRDFFVVKQDEDLVSESIARLIMTNENERVGTPNFGGNLKPMMFEQLDTDSLIEIENQLRETVELYEPRAILRELKVTANQDTSTVTISIGFNYVGKPNADPRFLELNLQLQ
jgi:phage baseplate assembly protein W